MRCFLFEYVPFNPSRSVARLIPCRKVTRSCKPHPPGNKNEKDRKGTPQINRSKLIRQLRPEPRS